ncbi:MAG: hypothetical protein WDO17_02410 [Alphaproteobacteria bacterium]
MDLWLQALCFYCVVTAPPAPQMARASGDIRYTEEPLGRGARLLRLSASDFIIDHDDWRQRRLRTFAENYANEACHGRYQLTASREPIVIRPSYAKQFVFRCR